MKWKGIYIALALVMCLSLLLVMVFTDDVTEAISVENQEFIIINDGMERVLLKYQGPGGRVVIPDGITKIGSHAFDGQHNLTEIIIPDSVRTIGSRAFRNCINLTNVQFSENLEAIGSHSFEMTSSLTNITIPASVKHFGDRSFAYSGLKSVTIMGNLTSAGGSAFLESPSLMSVIIYGDVNNDNFIEWFPVPPPEAIQDFTFKRSLALTSVVIYGDTYNGIGPGSFSNHANITIYGRADSNLEAFARENNYRFVIIDDTRPPSHPIFNEEPITVIINGKTLEFDVPPIGVNDRILVPLRLIFEEMGADVDWKGGWNPTITATKGDTIVVLTIGDTSPTINGQVVSIDQPGMIVNERTLAPLRFVAEAFGGTVVWDNENQTAHITK